MTQYSSLAVLTDDALGVLDGVAVDPSMSTSDYRSVAAEGRPPVSEAELAAMASQVFAASFGPGVRPGNDTPPQAVPPAPRADTDVRGVPGTAAAGTAPYSPAPVFVDAPSVTGDLPR